MVIALFTSCGGRHSSQTGFSRDELEDGTYCADVTYYNPNTGTTNTYQLNVAVENSELIKIFWNNGGWLDESHFSPEEIDSDGFCSFWSDKGYRYTVQIKGNGCQVTDRIRDTDDGKVSVCKKCGGEKDQFEEYCELCKRDIADQEDHTCKKCGNYDPFMFSTDDKCSDCKRREAEEEESRLNEDDEL